jgi:uncharacterized damage-inducible protein DinB
MSIDLDHRQQNAFKNIKQTNEGKKELLLDLLKTTHKEISWFPPLSRALDGLTAEQAKWCDHTNMNSIWQIVNHLVFWNTISLQRFKENSITDTGLKNEETFDIQDFSEKEWHETLIRLDDILNKWHSVLVDCSESRLHEHIQFFDKEIYWWKALFDVFTHNAYHTGQIVLIRKKQGSWVEIPW